MYQNWERVRNAMRKFAYDVQEDRSRYGHDWPTRNSYDSGREYGYPHNSMMGFNPQQSRGGEKNTHGGYYEHSQEKPFEEQMEQYFRDIKEGRVEPPAELCEMLSVAAQECVGGSSHGEMNESEHERYKDAIERLREASPHDKQKLIKELFEEDLSPTEQIVLRIMSEQKSYKRLAQERGITVEQFKDGKKSLKHKLKH